MLKLPVLEAEYENVVLKPSEYQQDMVAVVIKFRLIQLGFQSIMALRSYTFWEWLLRFLSYKSLSKN